MEQLMVDSVNPHGGNAKASDFLPKFYQTDANKKFLQATIDQLTRPGTVKKINGFIGRENAKATSGSDIFITAPTPTRQHYQLEPGFVVNDDLGNTTFFKDYADYINQVSVFGGNTSNHARLNKQEFYSWDPHIDWDKFVNFQNYYWLPYGPDSVKIAGQQLAITSEYTVTIESVGGDDQYIFTPPGLVRDPVIKLYRGQTYRFNITSPSNPFMIKTARSSGQAHPYLNNELVYTDQLGKIVTSLEKGTITFTVPYSCPDVLFYTSTANAELGGVFEILSIDDNSFMNVDVDLLGKKSYTLPNGTSLTNGMKVRFIGNVTPSSYATGEYYVEGVGTAIELISTSILELLSTYTTSETILFDNSPFDTLPFSDATSFAGIPEHIVINRASKDRNPWSRYNRWFHKDVIAATAILNGTEVDLNQTARAIRPIIEFEANLRLFNFGSVAIEDVDLIDSYTTDVFSTIEGQSGYNIDGISIAQGQRILFTADTDVLVKNKIYKVEFLTLNGQRQIHLAPELDPVEGQGCIIKQGSKYQGSTYWYNGSSWKLAQQKTKLNQTPLFDVADKDGVSYGDTSVYDGSTFAGTSLFSYKTGTGSIDTTLGFPLSYKNINNIGDIVFNFNLLIDQFEYKTSTGVVVNTVDVGYLKKLTPSGVLYVNGWQRCQSKTYQPATRIYKNSNKTNNFDIDIFNNITELDDLIVKVYINGIRLDPSKWILINTSVYKQVKLATDIKLTDVLTIKAFSSQAINENGHYEIPVNLQNNPLNDNIKDFTLGEVIDHVNSIIDNIPQSLLDPDNDGDLHVPEISVTGQTYDPDYINVRDLGNITQYGTKFVQHSGPASLSLYHITSENNNIINAIESSKEDYNKFKKNFIAIASTIGIDTDPASGVNLVLQKINQDKPKTSPYYFSDMVPYSAKFSNKLTVVDYRIKTYPLVNIFSMDELSTRAVLLYLNGVQLLYKKDYTFNSQGFVIITAPIQTGDTIVIDEYDNTNGSFVPATPTKLGIWPKYEPMIYEDKSLVTPRLMIQGHDGSQVLAYGDYRDHLVLELEKRIFNNIKVEYDPTVFDIYDVIPGYSRVTDYSLDEFNEVLAPDFYKWTSLVDRDFTKPLNYDRTEPFTFNYRFNSAPDGQGLPGYWKGIYRWMLDTDRPNTCPWEMLGFTIEPKWWDEVYGPAPYTSENKILWDDLATGTIREPNTPVRVNLKFARPVLHTYIPVDDQGNILSPAFSGLASGIVTQATESDFVFGDISPVESAWRRSSHYPFSVIRTIMLLHPAQTFGALLDRSRIVRNIAGQLIYKETGLRVSPKDIMIPSIYSSSSTVQTSGIINYVIDYILSDNLKSYDSYVYDLTNINAKLTHRIGAFTSKEKFSLLLDSKTPLSQGSVFVPQEDYSIVLNSSSPIKKITYSGVIVTKTLIGTVVGYEVKGYSKTQPYFKYYSTAGIGLEINVGGISEAFSTWTPAYRYAAGKIVEYNNRFYRVKALHTTTDIFNAQFYELLAELPVVGGQTAYIRTEWDKDTVTTVPYGTKFRTVQEVVDFLQGYGEWLKDQGFIFDDFNTTLAQVANWETSAKEFMFWTTQNWSTGQDKWNDWEPNVPVKLGNIVRYNGDYYRAITIVPASLIFNNELFVKLDGLSTLGSSVISLSPAAAKITFSLPLAVVDDIRNPFNSYEFFKVDGTPILPNFLNSYRNDNTVSYIPVGTDGIYSASFYLVQKEQVVILNNTTMFNDTIYNVESGYRQERIRVAGYVSDAWVGSFDAPGFIFDQATIQNWETWKDYSLGDIVKYKEFYYSAKKSLAGTTTFENNNWVKLDKKPEAQLLPNWNYKAGQFTDFYSLDSDNFDIGQQKMAQHLVGYQKRQYLENIIQDDVSEFKFYQGMIIEKGTKNVLNKLFDVLSADGKDSVSFYEEWAVRMGQYGASSAFENVEFILPEGLFKNNPQGFELVNYVDSSVNDFIIRQTPNDVYLKPVGYKNDIWPTIDSQKYYLRTPGHVRLDQVNVALLTIDDISSQDVTTFMNGNYVWCGFENNSWNVYRYTSSDLAVTNLTYIANDKEITLTAKTNIHLKVGEWVGINQTTAFNGFYKIKTVVGNKMTLVASLNTTPTGAFNEQQKVLLFVFKSQKINSINNLDSVRPKKINPGELLWTGGPGTSYNWETWQYNPVYSNTELINTEPVYGLGRGKQIVVNRAGTVMATTVNNGTIVVYDRAGLVAPWIQRSSIEPPQLTVDGLGEHNAVYLGDVIAMSPDGTWLATGTPLASYVSTNPQVGDSYTAVNTDNASYNSLLENQGAISLYKKDSSNVYNFVDSIISPIPVANELFGSNIVFGNDVMFVTAAGYGTTGRVYQLNYQTNVMASTAYNPTGSTGTIVKVSNTTDIEANMKIVGAGFTSGQYVTQVVDSTTLYVSASPDSTPAGVLEFTETNWQYAGLNLTQRYLGHNILAAGAKFGQSMSFSQDGNTLAVSAPGNEGYVFIYKKNGNAYPQLQQLTTSNIYTGFGTAVALSADASYIAISSVLYDGETIDQGLVEIREQYADGIGYDIETRKEIVNNNPSIAEYFGTKLSFMNGSETLVVYSPNSSVRDTIVIDSNTTTFDDNLTSFLFSKPNTGRIDIYDRYVDNWVFSETLKTNQADSRSEYSSGFAVGANRVVVGSPFQLDTGIMSGKIYDCNKPSVHFSWKKIYSQGKSVNLKRIKKAFLYNKLTNNIVSYLDAIDPSQGQIPGIAEQEIKYKTFYDPATYSIGNSSVTVDDGMAWSKSQVGTLWWDLRTAKFIESHDSEDVVYRNSTWNTLFPGASIDVYEWVESKLKPVEWNATADTETGLALDISGTALYDNNVYSIVRKYDAVAKTFKNIYYYWVKNKKTIPSSANRSMSAIDVADIIANPRGEGYKYLALTSSNSFSIVNCRSLLEDNNVVLSVEYWLLDNTTSQGNIHSQWKLISNDINSEIPARIEEKWIDSLCGKDTAGRVIPDPALPAKLRYGIENRPRQSMFVNRFEALKQFVEKTNQILIENQITSQRNLTKLDSYDLLPSIITGLYDTTVDTDAELRFANIGSFRKPTLTVASPTDGKITSVNIIEKGSGYLVPPYITVSGSGTGAVLRATINTNGQINGVTIISAGEGYDNNTFLTVRNYAVLVKNDSQVSGLWSVYSYEPTTELWSRINGQSYDTRKFWSYEDWYDTGYNQFTATDYAVDTFAELGFIDIKVGQTVKVRTTVDSTWVLLKKYSNNITVDWTTSYKVVGTQRGTIQLSSTLYEYANSVYGYDSELYDGGTFDNVASTELRIILNTLKNNIFVDNLKQEYLNLFFNSVRYAYSEQTYIDWIFKTSFVKAQHNVGNLDQPVTYKNDNLSDFESYIDEVKPYRTKIREYISSYSNSENSQTSVTDFDLLPVLENGLPAPVNGLVVNGNIQVDNPVINTYPWKFWIDNAGFKVKQIAVIDGGSGYLTPPSIRIISKSGSGAVARAFISSGKLTRISLLASGSGYLEAPTVIIDGNTTGAPARAVAIIGDSVVRSNLIKIKFDRTTSQYVITQLQETETFIATGSQKQFSLIWAPDVRVGKATVSIKLKTLTVSTEVLRDEYSLTVSKASASTYTRHYGTLTFDTAPAKDAVITVTYIKDWNLLNAADRIQYYYNPADGELGKDLSQLMEGVDYGGVIVSGLGFELAKGWDSLPYFSDKWDTFDTTFDDYIETVPNGKYVYSLPYIPSAGTELNIYQSKRIIESYESDGAQLSYNFNLQDINPIVTITTELAITDAHASYQQSGSNGTTLKVSNVIGTIVQGMSVIGTGFASGQTVISYAPPVAPSTYSTVILSDAPNIQPIGVLYFTKNISGVDILEVPDTSGLQAGDVLSITPEVANTISYDTRILRILSSTKVQLDQILFSNVTNSTATFTRTLAIPTDYVINITGVITLSSPVLVGSNINITSLTTILGASGAIRVDDGSIIADGITNIVDISSLGITVSEGDQIIIRKSTSDGSITPQETDYDTALQGGNLTYSSATGLSADDIIVDGDGFVTPTSSGSPEEVVPGQVVDTMAIKVFDRPSNGSAVIKVDSYLADGIQRNFKISQTPNSHQAVIVKFTKGERDNNILQSVSSIKTEIDDYMVLYETNEVRFVIAPPAGELVSIFSVGFNGTGILDLDYFIGDGTTNEFVTKATWVNLTTSLVYVNGSPAVVELFKTDISYENINQIGIRFITPPPADSVINYIIVTGSTQTFSITKSEIITPTGSDTYNLQNISGDTLPIESSMIVRVDQTILSGPNNSYFKIGSNRLNYIIDPAKFVPFSVAVNDIVVLADGILLTPTSDYTVDLSGITIKINRITYNKYNGTQLIVSIRKNQGYVYIPAVGTTSAQIKFAQTYSSELIEVTSFYKHDILDIQRTAVNVTANLSLTPDTVEYYTYTSLAGGLLKLDRTVIDDNYVWVLKNGILLTPSVDFKVNTDQQSITLATPPALTDEITLMTFSSNVLTSGIAYMQFKDMLNRTHFKRLSANKQTQLTVELKYTDTSITVVNASNFDEPNPLVNKPGIIEIHGERIEYFTKVGNVLGQIRRGTLGTGTPKVHPVSSYVQDIGSSETIPYTETTKTDRVISDGSNIVELTFAPTLDETSISKWFSENGYTFTGNFETASSYNINDVVVYSNIYYYTVYPVPAVKNRLATVDYSTANSTYWKLYDTTIPPGYSQSNEIEVFAGGTRLKKKPYSIYNVLNGPDSPAADQHVDSEFAVDGISKQVRLTTAVPFGTTVTVVKRLGSDWDRLVNIQDDNSKIAKFLKSVPGISYKAVAKSE
jgi:hypothetical protein